MTNTTPPEWYKPEPPTPKDSWLVWYLVIAIVLISMLAYTKYNN